LARASKLPLQCLQFPEAALHREAAVEEAVAVKVVVARNKHRSHRFL